MPTLFRFVRPEKLIAGEKYYLQETSTDNPMPKYSEVILIDYDRNPEFVYVFIREGFVEMCARNVLFQKSIVG